MHLEVITVTEIMNYNKFSLLLLVLLVSYFESGTSLECYTCASTEASTCGRDFNPSKITVLPCEGNNTMCITAKYKFAEAMTVTRVCGTKESCASLESCTTCTTDKCNPSNKLQLQFWLLPVLGLPLIKSFF
ncbi:hypothetical protein RI129_010480 [Pyrocoelia pectoralis]|uniref:Uncharacterized protein n=1 Tax=Pyrocoelia pectoralis TaxID=417401 RepID=A0AAN7ZJZ4_9COLE